MGLTVFSQDNITEDLQQPAALVLLVEMTSFNAYAFAGL